MDVNISSLLPSALARVAMPTARSSQADRGERQSVAPAICSATPLAITRPMVAVGFSRSQPWRTQNQKKPITRSNFFLRASSFSFQVCRHSVRLRGLNSLRKVMPRSSANPRSCTSKKLRNSCRVTVARPRASASPRKTPTASLTVVNLVAFTSSSPPSADCSYLRARRSACSQDLVFAETRNRPVRPGSVPSSHLGQRQRR